MAVSGFSCYISPVAVVNESCTVSDNTTLRPCYTLQQLNSTAFTQSSLRMVFLPGIHLLNQSLVSSNITEVEVYPWGEQLVVIECGLKVNWTFEHIEKLKIASLHFSYCHLKSSISQYIGIYNCAFTKSRHTYAVSFASQNISVCNCTFHSNNGGIFFNSEHIHIADSFFASNWRDSGPYGGMGGAILFRGGSADLIIERSKFINNTAGDGGAIYCYSVQTYLFISSTVFQSNSARSGGAIFGRRIEVHNCNFVNNSAIYSGGAISSDKYYAAFDILFTVYNTTFENNHCDENGGAIAQAGGSFKLHGCKFKNNSALNGGAVQFIQVDDFQTYGDRLAIVESTAFEENSADKFGGAVYFLTDVNISYRTYSVDVDIKSSIFSKNVAVLSGGAIFNEYFVKRANFLNSSFIDNQAGDNGGAIHWSCGTTKCQLNITGKIKCCWK